MDVRDYMQTKFAPSRADADPDTFLCPNPACDDQSGHFKIWVGDKWARGFCVKCWWPEPGQRDLYAIIAGIEGISRKEVLRRFGLLEQKRNLLDPGFDEPPVDLPAVMAKLDEPIRKRRVEPAPAVVQRDIKPANTGVRRIPPDPEHLALWRSWFPSILKPVSMMGRDAQNYLARRKFGKDLIKRYHLRYAELGEGSDRRLSQKFHGRLMIPVFSKGKLVFCQGRAMYEGQDPKYDSPWVPRPEDLKPGMFPWKNAGEAFFGADRAMGRERLVIVEGLFDAIRVGDGALALLGKGLTEARLGILIELKQAGAKEAILWLDNDVKPEERNKILAKIKRIMPARWTTSRLAKAKDAAEMKPEQVDQTLEEADELGFLDSLGMDED